MSFNLSNLYFVIHCKYLNFNLEPNQPTSFLRLSIYYIINRQNSEKKVVSNILILDNTSKHQNEGAHDLVLL